MLAYPEGETFFRRSSLSHGRRDGWNFDSDNETAFYRHALIEYVSNQAFAGGSSKQTYTHNRASYECKRAENFYRTYFCYFKDMPISYGGSTYPTRRHTVNCEANPNIYRDRDAGGGIVVKLAHVQLPTKAERYMWIDMVQPIRAIYFPVAWKSDESYQTLCTYLMINFTQRQSAVIWRPDMYEYASHTFSPEFGLSHHIGHTLGIDVQEMYNLLILPRQLRTSDVYKSKIVTIHKQHNIGTVENSEIRPYVTLDFAHLVSANYGVELQWRPYQWSSFILKLLQNIVESAISMVPTVGPLLSVSFSLGIKAITDPDAFRKDFAGELGDAVIDSILESAGGARKNMPDGFVKKKKSTKAGGTDDESSPLDFIFDSSGDQTTKVLAVNKDKATLEREAKEAEDELESIGSAAWILASTPKEEGNPKHADGEEFCYDAEGCLALANADPGTGTEK